jgi:hypothetical protein
MRHPQLGQRGGGLLFVTAAEAVVGGKLVQQRKRVLARQLRIDHDCFPEMLAVDGTMQESRHPWRRK